jgi:hypothetical protein
MLSLNKFRLLLLFLSFFLGLHWEPWAFGCCHIDSLGFDHFWALTCLLAPPFLLIFSLLSTRKFYPEYWRQHELKSRLLNPLLTAIGWCGYCIILPPVFWFFSLAGLAELFVYHRSPFLGFEFIDFAFVGVITWRSCKGIKRWKKVFVTFWMVMFSIWMVYGPYYTLKMRD